MIPTARSPFLVKFSGSNSEAIAVDNISHVSIGVVFGADVSAGQYVLETCPEKTFAGTWSNLDTVDFVANTYVPGTAQQVQNGFVRVRITTPVAGGTANCYLFLNSQYEEGE